MIRTLIFLLFSFSCFNTIAQAPPFFTIGTEEFSNVDVYDILYDDNSDLLYAATNRGLYVYRQNKFTVLKAHPEQVGVSLFQISKDNKGRLFCRNTAGQVFQIMEDRLDLFYQLPRLTSGYNFMYFFDENNNLIVSTTLIVRKITPSGDEELIFNAGNPKTYFKDAPEWEGGIRNTTQLENGDIYFGPKSNAYYLKYSKGQLTSHVLSNQDGFVGPSFFQLGERACYTKDGSLKSISEPNFSAPIELDDFALFHQLDKDRVSVLSETKGLLIFGLEKDSLVKASFGFENYFLSAITQNKNKTIFLGTFKEGIIVIPNSQINRYSSVYPFSGITVTKDNQVYLSNQKSELFIHDNGPVKLNKYFSSLDNPFYLEGSYGFLNETMHGIVYEEAENRNNLRRWSTNIKDLKEFDKKMVVFVSAGAAGIFLKDHSVKLHSEFAEEKHPGHYTFPLDGRGRSITYIEKDNKIYCATNSDVYSKIWNTDVKKSLLYKGKAIHPNYLTQSNGQLLIGTEKEGILFYENEVFRSRLSERNGLHSNTILKVKAHENFIVIRSVKGVQIFDQNTHRFVNLGEAEGVISSKVIDFAINEDELWLLEKHGYYSVPFDKLTSKKTQTKLGRVELESILVNEKEVSLTSNAEFEYDQNNIQFFFDYRDLETKNESAFLYKLVGAQDEWKILESSVNTLEFPSLAPGTYTLLLKIRYRGKETKTVKYKFTILAPFWLRGWFFILCGLFIISLVSFFYLRRVRKNKRERRIELEKQKMQTDIFESKLKAIRSQMNPHFIFNSLNSIQALVLEQDAKKSYDYIEKIATLVRKTLQFSEKNFVQLTDEIDFLTIYADLESLRMKEEFQFSIVNNIEDDVQIPALLIQPFIENAIHHGLLHKVGEKRLRIEFNNREGNTSCTITDNGIGREQSREIKSRQNSHESFSLNAIKERLQILSEQNNAHFNYHIKDLYDKDGNAKGTEVTVYYPHINNY